ncbi:hypothetical protein P4V48_12230, partial [Bacillus thuringiensis]|nr:hypothetical protein [Bacillus thuringiensis]
DEYVDDEYVDDEYIPADIVFAETILRKRIDFFKKRGKELEIEDKYKEYFEDEVASTVVVDADDDDELPF